MTDNEHNSRKELAVEIERMSLRSENRRFLRNMPMFHVDMTLPDDMRELLARLDRQQAQATTMSDQGRTPNLN